jgi:asparagine synthase (glutamine-hydrolysing)
MCGIAGIVKFDPRERVEEHRLQRMGEVIAHRGPDGKGLLVDGPVGLVHRRLAIVDVSRAGAQPMANEDGSVWTVFNGEIYNHAALRPGLEARGHRYRSRCDTEAILHVYEEEGDRLVDHLHGMFAFALWDRVRGQLLLARDRLGIKPLYYAQTETELLFASEIKALLAAGSIRPVFNEEALPEFLSTRFIAGEETFFRGVRKVPPGHVLTWSQTDGFLKRRYWHLPGPVDRPSGTIRAQAPDLRVRLEAAVESHLMSDVPLGVFLSGGLDSTVLAALVARSATQPVRTFAVGFADRDANELGYARLAADHIGTEHREVTVTPTEFFEALPHLLWHEDEPLAFTSSVPLYFVARLARDHVKVVLTGEGADELFLGYNRYRVTMWNARLGRPYWAVASPAIRNGVRRLIKALPSRLSRIADRTFLTLEPGIRELFLDNFAVMPTPLQRHLLRRPDLLDQRDPYAAAMQTDAEAGGGILDRLSRMDIQTYLHELLMKQDQMSMAASIESRVPFLDDALVEYVAAMPGECKIRGWQTKAVLRAAVQDLVPPAILTRPKMGFPVPVGRWFRDGFWPVVEEFVLGPRAKARGFFDHTVVRHLADEHRSGRGQHGDRLWLLVNLEIWHRMFCDGEDTAHVMDGVLSNRRQRFHAHSLGQNERPVAGDDGWARPQLPHPVAAVAAP